LQALAVAGDADLPEVDGVGSGRFHRKRSATETLLRPS